MMGIFGRAQGKEVARRLAFFCLGSERLPRQPGVPAGPERFQPSTRDTHNQLALVWPPFRALQMASAEMLLWSCSAHNRLQLRKLLKASLTSAVKTMKSHFFTQVPHSDPRNPQNASWGKEPISFGCLSSLGVLSGHSDASVGEEAVCPHARFSLHQATLARMLLEDLGDRKPVPRGTSLLRLRGLLSWFTV